MGSVKVTVYGRIKPRQKNIPSQDYKLKYGDQEDQITFPVSKTSGRKVFRFKKIFGEDATQKQVFEAVAKPVIKNVFEGYNGTIFTYGQTGSGKTHTMTGSLEDWVDTGLIPRTVQEVFQMKERDTVVSITYFEIYNEHVYDLIKADRADSEASQDYDEPNAITSFRNLSVHIVRSACEALLLYRRGDANKMVAETSSNARSSRSHVIFSIGFEFPHPKEEMISLKPVLYLVDLAGSERITKCKTPVANPWETRYINLSLHYLEQVLVALRQPGRVHIPYRNSLMTALLRNSLGGNCITAMVATFSVSVYDIEVNQEEVHSLQETLQTCRFAERIALIKNDVKLSELASPQKEIDSLKKENERLKTQLKLMGNEQILDHLTTKDKEKCNEMVQNFLRDNDFFSLPLTDIRRMEFCFYLMRNEILRKKSQALVKVESKSTDGIKMIESSLWPLHEGRDNNNSSSTCNKSISKNSTSNNSTSNNSTSNNSICNNDTTSNTSTYDAICCNDPENDLNTILGSNNNNTSNNGNINNNSNSNTTSSNINVAEKNPRRKRNPLELPKVNITYKRWKSTEQLPEKVSSTKKQPPKVQQPGKTESKNSDFLQGEPPFEEPKVSAEYVQEKDYGITSKPRSSNFLKLSGESEKRDIIDLINVSSSNNIEAQDTPVTIFIDIDGNGNGNLFLEDPNVPSDISVEIFDKERKSSVYELIEDLDYPITGLCIDIDTNVEGEIEKCKALKDGSLHHPIDVVQTHDIPIYKEPEIEIHQPKTVIKDDREKNADTKDDNLHRPNDQFSAICVPLTGDQEVDEEILKFYRLRYEIFRNP